MALRLVHLLKSNIVSHSLQRSAIRQCATEIHSELHTTEVDEVIDTRSKKKRKWKKKYGDNSKLRDKLGNRSALHYRGAEIPVESKSPEHINDFIGLFSESLDAEKTADEFLTVPLIGRRLEYMDQIRQKKEQASRSILLSSKNNEDHVRELCERYGEVESIDKITRTHPGTSTKPSPQYLIEFKDTASAEDAMKNALRTATMTPHRQRVIYEKGAILAPRNIMDEVDNGEIYRAIQGSLSIGDCIIKLQSHIAPHATQDKLAYMQCQLIDDLLYGVMAEVQTIPHGSALSSLTTQSGDLDMVIHPRGLYKYGLTDKRLCSGSLNACFNSRAKSKDSWETLPDVHRETFIGDMLHFTSTALRHFASETNQVLCLANAKHPIVRFNSAAISQRCDLSFSPGIDVSVMASLSIRLLCDHDVRFVYLSRCLRLWAKKHGLTNLQPGGYLINFSLTHLIIFYLQQLNILPTLEHIISADYNPPPPNTEQSLSQPQLAELGMLYREFFSFWATFDYKSDIDIRVGRSSHCFHTDLRAPMRIVNTVEPDRNIAQRMQEKYHRQFVLECAETYRQLSDCGHVNHDDISKVFCRAHGL